MGNQRRQHRRPRVLIVYPHLPHYRFGIFKELLANTEIDYCITADSTERSGTIACITQAQLPYHPIHNAWLGPLLWQHGLLRHIRRVDPDAVIFLGDVKHLTTWIASAILRLRGRTVVYWTIGWHRPEEGPKRWTRLLFYRLANSLFLYGNVASRFGRDMGYPEYRMLRIGNSRTSSLGDQAASDATIRRLRRELGTLRPIVLTAVVRLNPAKRLDVLLDAVSILQGRGHSISVLMVGDGPSKGALAAQASSRKLDVRFLGALYSEDTLSLVYEATDLTILPSAAGLTVIQSLDHGTPVITHRDADAQMPEYEAIRDGVNGALFDRDSAASLASAIEPWLDGHARSAAVREACRDEVRLNWSPQTQERCISAWILKHVRARSLSLGATNADRS